jgi:hypothetical protein
LIWLLLYRGRGREAGSFSMEWITESREAKNARLSERNREKWKYECEWHPWTAWRPVWISSTERAWLCDVERRLTAWYRREMPEWYEYDLRKFEYRRIGAKDQP